MFEKVVALSASRPFGLTWVYFVSVFGAYSCFLFGQPHSTGVFWRSKWITQDADLR